MKNVTILSILIILAIAGVTAGVGFLLDKHKPVAEKKETEAAANQNINQPADTSLLKKGEGYGNNVPLLKPASTFWKAKGDLIYKLIKHQVDLHEAINGKIKSHEEFMEKIVKPNQSRIKLPELKPGLEYYYDPDKGELMVRSIQKK